MAYKFSIYNSYLTIGNRHMVIYNSYSQKIMIFRNQLFPIPTPEGKIDGNDILCNNIDDLIGGGMLVSDTTDEISQLKNRISSIDNNNNECILHINPTLDCNFNCWYCYENHIKGSVMSKQTVGNVISYIDNVINSSRDLKIFNLSFFGGEPFLKFNDVVKPVVEYTKKECDSRQIGMRCHFTTNGSLIPQHTIEFLKNYNTGFQITLDGGKEHHNKVRFYKGGRGSYDQILKTIDLISGEGMHIVLRINFTEENILSVSGILEDISRFDKNNKDNISIDLQRVWQNRPVGKDDVESIADKIRLDFKNAGFCVHANYIPSNVIDSCYGDKKNHVIINYDGNAYACTARDFDENNSIGVLRDNGTIAYKDEIINKRRNSKFSKEICHKCRIAPLCAGGCCQRALESGDDDICVYGYSEKNKDDIVMDIIHAILSHNKDYSQHNAIITESA